MSELKPCPFCGELPIQFVKDGLTQIRCNNTQCWIVPATSFYTDRKTAVEAWEERAQPAEPLTLDELRKMRGQVVDIPESEFWYSGRGTVLDDGVYDPKDQDGYWPFEHYGEWLVYAHKPEGEQDA